MSRRASSETTEKQPPSNAIIASTIVAVLTLIGTIVVAYFGFLPTKLSIESTRTAEAKPTQVVTTLPSSVMANNMVPVSILVYENCYHLGDDEHGDYCHALPQTNPFEGKFQVEQVGGLALIQMTVRDVGTDETQEPIRIYVNGYFVDYLNRHVTEETSTEIGVEIPLPGGLLRVGENNILIFSAPSTNVANKNADDFEFKNLRIVFK